jgi:hypothetical protein
MDLLAWNTDQGEAVDGRYSTAITAWMVAHECVTMDLTPEQLRRFRALERVEWVPENAPRLLFAKWLFLNGGLGL